jgi:hypothetical protein
MCSHAVCQTRISKVVIGRVRPWVGGIGSNHPVLTDPQIPDWGQPPNIIAGGLESECRAAHASAKFCWLIPIWQPMRCKGLPMPVEARNSPTRMPVTLQTVDLAVPLRESNC